MVLKWEIVSLIDKLRDFRKKDDSIFEVGFGCVFEDETFEENWSTAKGLNGFYRIYKIIDRVKWNLRVNGHHQENCKGKISNCSLCNTLTKGN